MSQKNCTKLWNSNFEAMNTLMSEMLAFPTSLDLYTSFDTLFVCFHVLIDIWQKVSFKTWFFAKLEF